MRLRIAVALACAISAAPVSAQSKPLSRNAAVQTAMEQGARLGLARADTAVANAAIVAARAYPNPSLTASRSKSTPQYHFSFDIPVEPPSIRSLRVRTAEVGRQAADLRYQFARATAALEADTTYTHAVAAREHLVLSQRTALDADSLLHMVERRRDAGDASDMDVQLARIAAGLQANIASADSLTYVSTVLDLQAVLGMTAEGPDVTPSDSLTALPDALTPTQTLAEAAASLSVESATLAARLQHRSIFSLPSLSIGFEAGDPTGAEPGILPTFGIGLTLPLFDRNRGAIAQAEAERARAVAELTLARVETRNQINHATRERAAALARVARHRQLVASATNVAAMSLIAYAEGASSLPNVLEAQRIARDILGQFIDALATAWIATAELRVLATPVPPTVP